jgi:hypothetical protein
LAWKLSPGAIFPQKTGPIAAFGPSNDKKMRLLQSVFHQIPRNPMMLWN